MLRLVNGHFTKALNFNTYRLEMQSQIYDGRISGRMSKRAKRMDVEIKLTNFKPSDPIFVLPVLHNLKTASDSNTIQESVAMCPFQQFMKDPAKAAFEHGVCATKEDDRQQEWSLTAYCQTVSYLLGTFAADDVLAENEAEIIYSKEQERLTAVRNSEYPLEKALRCAFVYHKGRLKRVFIEGLHESNRFSIRTYCSANKDTIQQNLTQYATSLSKVQEGANSSSTRNNDHGDTRGPKSNLRIIDEGSKLLHVLVTDNAMDPCHNHRHQVRKRPSFPNDVSVENRVDLGNSETIWISP